MTSAITNTDPDTPAPSDASASLAVAMSRAEIDQQIATARAMPRSVERAVKNILSLAIMDEQGAQECMFAVKRGGESVTGPSIRMAEIVHSQWGNCRVGVRVTHVDRVEKYVEVEGIFHDLETNARSEVRERRSIATRTGGIFSQDMIVMAGKGAAAIAKRNAILAGVPKMVWRKAYDAVVATLRGDIETLTTRREAHVDAFVQMGVKKEQVFEALGVQGFNDITLDHIPALVGMRSAIKNGEETIESMFAREKQTDRALSSNPLIPPAPAVKAAIQNAINDRAASLNSMGAVERKPANLEASKP